MSFKKKGVVISGKQQAGAQAILDHAGVKPSILTSQPTISTGSEDLDGLLGHWGLPLGNVVMLEETGTTDFASILLRSFGAQGVIHNRLDSGATKLVVIGSDESWGRELPGLYKDKKTAKKEKIEHEQSKVSVGNMTEKNMKIAWRYTRPNATTATSAEVTEVSNTKPDYNATFDFTTRIIPAPSKEEVTYLGSNLASAISQLEKLLASTPSSTVVRVVVPSLLHPVVYEPSTIKQVLPFLHTLRNLCRKYTNCGAVMSISLELFPRHSALTRYMEHEVDGVIHLEPFKVPLLPDSNEKQDQGLIHIYKLPVSSEKGVMVKRLSEHAFRVGKRQFEIKEFGIPIDESENAGPQTTNPIDY